MNTVRTALAATLLALAAPAFAAGGLAGFERDFGVVDRNGDGKLSWHEFEDRLAEIFFFTDLDSDGMLSRSEAPPGMARRWDGIERDGDGKASLREFVADHRPMFLTADSDGDGELSRGELDALPPVRGQGNRGNPPPRHGRGKW